MSDGGIRGSGLDLRHVHDDVALRHHGFAADRAVRRR